MKIEDYVKFGLAGPKHWQYVLCEDPFAENAPPLNRAGWAFGVRCGDSGKSRDGLHPCSCLAFDLPDARKARKMTGGLGHSVWFNPETEEFHFGPAMEMRDQVRPIDWEFYLAASHAGVPDLERLIGHGANPDAPIYNDIGNDYFAIHEAACNPDPTVLEFLFSLGIDPCKKDCWNAEPLEHAVRKNSLEVVRWLVEHGNDPDAVDHDGNSVMGEAALNPDIRVIEYLLAQGAGIDSGADDSTGLCHALTSGPPERMKFFMDHGADLQMAMEYGCACAPLGNIRFALESGYDPNTFEDDMYANGQRAKVMDHLDESRQALFREFGGEVYWKDAHQYGRRADS